jgi:hypothetical protein
MGVMIIVFPLKFSWRNAKRNKMFDVCRFIFEVATFTSFSYILSFCSFAPDDGCLVVLIQCSYVDRSFVVLVISRTQRHELHETKIGAFVPINHVQCVKDMFVGLRKLNQ